jgi:UDP-glucose 4-epimerase
MKILITGSKGFVGSHLTGAISQNHEVINYDIKEGRDIFNENLLNKCLKNVDVVVHLAALVSGAESWEKPEEYLVNNGLGTYRVVEAAIKNKVKRIISFSSAAVYGKPLTPYGASKLWAETILNMYKDQIEAVIVRPFNIYGVGQNPAYGYAIHNFSEGIRERGEIEIFGSGNQTRDFVFIDDVVRVVEKLILSPLPSGPVDLGTGKDIKIKDLAKIIGKILGKKYNIKYLDARKEPFVSKANLKALGKIGINVSDFTGIEKGLKSVLLK